MKYVFGFLMFSMCMLALALVLYNKASSERAIAVHNEKKQAQKADEAEKRYLICKHANLAAKLYVEQQNSEIESLKQLLELCDCER